MYFVRFEPLLGDKNRALQDKFHILIIPCELSLYVKQSTKLLQNEKHNVKN